MRILLVEHRTAPTNSLAASLRSEGLIAEVTDTGEEALELVRHYDFDLLVLSLALPDMEGSTVIRRMRTAGRTTPVLAVCAGRNLRARTNALAAGADDVVDQDIDLTELVARIRAIVRRSRGHSQPRLQIGTVILNLEQQTVLANEASIPLTGKEFAILQLLMLRKNMVMTKEAILAQLYGGMDEPELKIIDVFVCKIRKKLAKAGLADFIGTVWGRGYVVRDQASSGARPEAPFMPQPTQVPRRLAWA
jgi:two-component system cell cycle response regulator CtrA